MKLLVIGEPELYSDKRTLDAMLDTLVRSGKQVERIDPHSREGISQMGIYDVMSTPSFIVIHDDGAVISSWQHTQPSYDELTHAFGAFS